MTINLRKSALNNQTYLINVYKKYGEKVKIKK